MLGAEPLGSARLGGGAIDQDYYDDISIFLPAVVNNKLEADYFEAHLKSFRTNQQENPEYALLALHQLFMFTAYGLLYGCLHSDPALPEKAFTIAPVRDSKERRQLKEISSPFTLSLLKERTFFEAISLVGCDINANMAQLKRIIDNRNDLSHCNGKFCVDFAADIKKYIEALEILHAKFSIVITKHLVELNDVDFGVVPDGQLDQLRAFLSDHYISQRMLELVMPSADKTGLTKKAHDLLASYFVDV